MKILEETSVVLPAWVRLMFVCLALVFGALTFWSAGLGEFGWATAVLAVLSGSLGLLLLVAAVKGRIARWMWLLPWLPGS